MRRSVIFFVMMVIVLPAAWAGEGEAAVQETHLKWEQAALSEGEALFTELCASCHGADGTGEGPVAEALKIGVPDLTLLARSNEGTFPIERTEKAIRGDATIPAHGSAEMPVWGSAFRDVRPDWKMHRREGFAELRIQALAHYVQSLQVK